jgi:GTPase SAR1 family protein
MRIANIAMKVIAAKQCFSLEIWDLPADHYTKPLHRDAWLKGVDGVLLVTDCGSMKSFGAIDEWMLYINQTASHEHRRIPVVLVANKSDLPTHKKKITLDDIMFRVEKTPAISRGFMVSAATGRQVDDCFDALFAELVRTHCDPDFQRKNSLIVDIHP